MLQSVLLSVEEERQCQAIFRIETSILQDELHNIRLSSSRSAFDNQSASILTPPSVLWVPKKPTAGVCSSLSQITTPSHFWESQRPKTCWRCDRLIVLPSPSWYPRTISDRPNRRSEVEGATVYFVGLHAVVVTLL
jgi:hypothetical protein